MGKHFNHSLPSLATPPTRVEAISPSKPSVVQKVIAEVKDVHVPVEQLNDPAVWDRVLQPSGVRTLNSKLLSTSGRDATVQLTLEGPPTPDGLGGIFTLLFAGIVLIGGALTVKPCVEAVTETTKTGTKVATTLLSVGGVIAAGVIGFVAIRKYTKLGELVAIGVGAAAAMATSGELKKRLDGCEV